MSELGMWGYEDYPVVESSQCPNALCECGENRYVDKVYYGQTEREYSNFAYYDNAPSKYATRIIMDDRYLLIYECKECGCKYSTIYVDDLPF